MKCNISVLIFVLTGCSGGGGAFSGSSITDLPGDGGPGGAGTGSGGSTATGGTAHSSGGALDGGASTGGTTSVLGSGGTTASSGGTTSTGGSGGMTASGGATSTGGVSGTGGSSTGGTTNTGGTTSSGGTSNSTGGTTACTPVTHSNGVGQTWQDCVPLNTFNDEQVMKACQAFCPTCPCVTSTACGVGFPAVTSAGAYRWWWGRGSTTGVVYELVASNSGGVMCSAKSNWN